MMSLSNLEKWKGDINKEARSFNEIQGDPNLPHFVTGESVRISIGSTY